MKEPPAILVVDDNPDHLELTVMALVECCDRADGHGKRRPRKRSTSCSDGHARLPRHRAAAAMVILDMKLVRLHGLEVLKAMRKDPRTATIPVVMHSSSTEKSDMAACDAHGANSYVRKATDYYEPRLKMRQLYDFWMTANERRPVRYALKPRSRAGSLRVRELIFLEPLVAPTLPVTGSTMPVM